MKTALVSAFFVLMMVFVSGKFMEAGKCFIITETKVGKAWEEQIQRVDCKSEAFQKYQPVRGSGNIPAPEYHR